MPLYMLGAELVAFYPHGPIFEGSGLNITVMSYQESVDIGVIACRESVHDVGQITESFAAAIARLVAAAEQENAAKENGRESRRRSRSTPSA
jgi:diacylglycerol O-acyltransferase